MPLAGAHGGRSDPPGSKQPEEPEPATATPRRTPHRQHPEETHVRAHPRTTECSDGIPRHPARSGRPRPPVERHARHRGRARPHPGPGRRAGAFPLLPDATATVPVVSDPGSNNSYGSALAADDTVCAGRPSGDLDTCQDDSGGPLFIGGVLAGITSWGEERARDGQPGVLTRLTTRRASVTAQTYRSPQKAPEYPSGECQGGVAGFHEQPATPPSPSPGTRPALRGSGGEGPPRRPAPASPPLPAGA
ncbi:trypsin-like serine protease [Streptomyces sp. MUM 2J]|nr:trypsin-like serine protease [Streptomyces sp. MUM 2J]MCH0566015.1 trypsin-like serine protease [Streptomyces sp. MUM 2J]